MAGLVIFARKLWPGWLRAAIILIALAWLVGLGMWISQFAFPQ
jgi:hypothetical protein